MSGDIVEKLRKIASRGRMDDAEAQVVFDAADEIVRLRAAGDAMAKALDALCYSYCGNEDDADLVDAWNEVRRG